MLMCVCALNLLTDNFQIKGGYEVPERTRCSKRLFTNESRHVRTKPRPSSLDKHNFVSSTDFLLCACGIQNYSPDVMQILYLNLLQMMQILTCFEMCVECVCLSRLCMCIVSWKGYVLCRGSRPTRRSRSTRQLRPQRSPLRAG